MTLDTANQQEVAYQTKSDWWATAALGYSFKFKYLVDVVNGSNSQELGQLTSGNIDWSNNYLPGINMLARRAGRQQRLHAQVLRDPEPALHAVRQHGVARAQHHQGPDEQRQLPPGAGRTR